jgi:hypothetical protein
MKEKTLSFPFIIFLETGFFKGLRRIQTKNPFPCGRARTAYGSPGTLTSTSGG